MAAQPDVVRDRHIQAQVQAQPQAQSGDGKSSSRTVTDTIIGKWLSLVDALNYSRQDILYSATVLRASTEFMACVGEHEHTIVGYSLVKGIGDGEPIASERFSVGGHEWVSASCAESSLLSFCPGLGYIYVLCLLQVLLFYPDGKKSSSTEGHLAPPGLPAPAGGNGGANQQGGGQGQVLHLPIPPGPIPANNANGMFLFPYIVMPQPIMQTVCPSFLTFLCTVVYKPVLGPAC